MRLEFHRPISTPNYRAVEIQVTRVISWKTAERLTLPSFVRSRNVERESTDIITEYPHSVHVLHMWNRDEKRSLPVLVWRMIGQGSRGYGVSVPRTWTPLAVFLKENARHFFLRPYCFRAARPSSSIVKDLTASQ